MIYFPENISYLKNKKPADLWFNALLSGRLTWIITKFNLTGFMFHTLLALLLISPEILALGRKQMPLTQSISQELKMEFDTLFNAGLAILYSDPDSSRIMAMKAIALVENHEIPEHIRALNLLGASYNIQSNFTRALDVYKEALEIADKIGDTASIANIFNNIGVANMKIGNYSEALDFFLKASHYYDLIADENRKSSTINNVGLLYMEIKNYDKALTYFKQALDHAKSRNDSLSISNSLTNFGVFYSNTGEPDSAFKYMNESIALNTRIDNQYGLAVVFIAKANVYNTLEDYYKAVECFYQSLQYAEKLNHSYQISSAYFGLAGAYLHLRNFDLSLQYAQKAMDVAVEGNHEKRITETHGMLSQVYEKTSDYKLALEHYQKHVELEKELINQNKLHQIYNLEIDYLNQAKEIQQLEIQRQDLLLSKKNNIIVFIIFAFILVIGGVYLIYLNNNHRREAAHQKDILILTEKKSRAAIEAELQERNRIGQELHDGLGQMLSAVRMNISALQQKTSLNEESKKELVDFAIESVDKAFYELRDISHNLAPSVLAEKGLTGALKDLSNQVNQSKHLQMNFEVYGMNGSLDTLIENTLYRASQELLTNAIKHAKATTFSVQLVKSNTEITLMVEDNGKGFAIDQTLILPGGGLNNIRSRVENLNGQVFIDAMENRGSIVTIVIPIKHPEHARKED